MRPYYEADGIQLFHGDCREILPSMDPARVLGIADPPYGIAQNCDYGSRMQGGGVYHPIAGDDEPFDPTPLLRFQLVAFGAQYYADKLPPSPSWIIWDKVCSDAAHSVSADAELAWTNCGDKTRVFRHLWNGAYRASEAGTPRVHPTQKPVALAKWIISRYARTGDTIVEPYMGSGFAVVAAKELGFAAIGCDVAENYCEIAARRLSQRVLDFGVSA